MRLKIAFFVAEFPVLSETFVIRQVAGMVRAGHDVAVVAGQWGERDLDHALYRATGLRGRVQVLRQGGRGRLARLLMLARFAVGSLGSAAGRRRLGLALRAARSGSAASLLDIAAQAGVGPVGRFDAIIAHFGPAGVRAMHLQQAGLLEGPIATVFHGFDISDHATIARHRANYRALFRETALMLPISELWRERLIAWGAPPDRVQVLRMGVDLDRLEMLAADRPLSRPLRVLSVARFTEKKGLRYAIKGVCSAGVPVRYDVIGSGPLAAELEALAKRGDGAAEVRFLGRQPHQQVFAALEKADVFLLPSVTASGGDMEGIPVALMEAMAKGVLVIATRHSGIPELIDDGDCGLLVAERDAAGISEALRKVQGGGFPVAGMRLRARAKVSAQFDNAALDEQLARVCRELNDRSSRSEPALRPPCDAPAVAAAK